MHLNCIFHFNSTHFICPCDSIQELWLIADKWQCLEYASTLFYDFIEKKTQSYSIANQNAKFLDIFVSLCKFKILKNTVDSLYLELARD